MPIADPTSSHQYGKQSWYCLNLIISYLDPQIMSPPTKRKLAPGHKIKPVPALQNAHPRLLVLLLRFLRNHQRLYGLCVKGSREKIRKPSSHQTATRRKRQSGHRTSRSAGLAPTGWAGASNGNHHGRSALGAGPQFWNSQDLKYRQSLGHSWYTKGTKEPEILCYGTSFRVDSWAEGKERCHSRSLGSESLSLHPGL